MPHALRRTCETLLLTLLAFSVLWKGGKSLETTWLFAIAGSLLILLQAAWNTPPAVAVPRRLWWPAMTLFAWTVLSFAYSSTRNYGFDEVLQSAGVALLLCWMIRMQLSGAERKTLSFRVARTIAVVAYSACAVGVLVYVLQPVNRFVGSFFDQRFHTDYWPNAWAQFCLLAWPMIVWTVFSPEAGWKRSQFSVTRVVLHWAVVAFFLSCLLLSYSRAGFLAFLGQLALCLCLLAVGMRRRVNWHQLIVTTLSVGFFAMLWFSAINVLRSHYHPVESVLRKATFSSAEGNSSFSERAQFWKQAFSLSLEKPLTGWGPYSFRFVQPRLQQDVLATSDHAHNIILKYAMERGWPAALLLLLLAVVVYVHGLRRWWHGVLHYQHGTHLTLAFLVALAGVAAHNLVDYNVQFVGILLPLTLIAGIVAVPLSPRTTPARAKAQRVVESLLALLVLAFALREGYYLIISSRGRHAEAQGKALQAIVWYSDAESALFTRDLLLSKASLLLEPGKLDESHLTEARQALDDYERVNAQDARLWKLRGDLAVAAQRPTEAMDAYRKAYSLGKYNDIGIAHLLLREMAGSNVRATPEIDAWRNELERVLNDFALAIEENAHFISLSHNVEGAIETASLLARLYPRDADAYRQLTERIRAKSQDDRTRFEARPDGLLWKAAPQ